MDDNEHPEITKVKELMGGSMPETISTETIPALFLHRDPLSRAEELAKAKAYLAEDSGQNDLRKKASMLTLYRQMFDIDKAMRKAGR
jgi:hypothetical protein